MQVRSPGEIALHALLTHSFLYIQKLVAEYFIQLYGNEKSHDESIKHLYQTLDPGADGLAVCRLKLPGVNDAPAIEVRF